MNETILPDDYEFDEAFPRTPFESIGFAISGGGYRAAAYGLGFLSLLNEVTFNEDGAETQLLKKVRYISSASGGTITATLYAASIKKGWTFKKFFKLMDEKMTGEKIIQSAIALLRDDTRWTPGGKSRNLINAFALAYDEVLFEELQSTEKNLGFLMGAPSTHLDEFCFNATEFYTGISFRFQGGNGTWQGNQGGRFGNSNIEISWSGGDKSMNALKQIKLADALAASSCFPMGFEPIIYPRDFTYPKGPTIAELKDALELHPYTWDEGLSPEEKRKSQRAEKEFEFAKKKEFGLMDGGICDNQGLFSMREAHERHHFDLMLVNDVASFYMNAYVPVQLDNKIKWKKSLTDYWNRIKDGYRKISKILRHTPAVLFIIAILFCLPIVLERFSIAALILAFLGFLIGVGAWRLNRIVKTILRQNAPWNSILEQGSLTDIYKYFFPANNFMNRTAEKVIAYLQEVPISVILQMLVSRAQSANTMVSDIFLKHVRRLIYDPFYQNRAFRYRRLDNPIYRLSYSNRKNARQPRFDEQGTENANSYKIRKEAFLLEVKSSCKLNPDMMTIAERAYNANTTLWFTSEEENNPASNLRKDIIATGQFSTCYSLIRYTLSLKHSRYFISLDQKHKDRINQILDKLKLLMIDFEKDPYVLYDKFVP